MSFTIVILKNILFWRKHESLAYNMIQLSANTELLKYELHQ